MSKLLPTLLLASLLSLGTNVARAYHTDEKRLTPGTAFTLHKQEWQLGPFHADYGALDHLQLSTYVLPWVTGFANLQTKLLLFRNERWAVSLRPGVMYVNSNFPKTLYGVTRGDTDVRLWIVPIEGYASLLIKRRFTLTLAGVYNYVTGSGTYDPSNFDGAAAASNAQLGLGFQWRINRIVELILQTRWVAFQEASGAGAIHVNVDEQTEAEVQGQGDTNVLNDKRGFSASLAASFAWKTTNLRVGVGYGNYNVPGINIVVPERHPFPVFDLYWRFGGVKKPLGDLQYQ